MSDIVERMNELAGRPHMGFHTAALLREAANEIARLTERCDAYKDALVKYGRHDPHCDWHCRDEAGAKYPCTCGLTALAQDKTTRP